MALFGKQLSKYSYLMIISFFGVGFISKKMPGTVGSLVATLMAVLIVAATPNSCAIFWAITVTTFVVGVWGCDRYIVRYRHEIDRDPKYVVIDEVCGIFCGYSMVYPIVSFLGAKPIVALFINFAMFRGFDILKPFSIKKLEKILARNDNTVGFGIMVDDILAAVYAALGHVVLLVLWVGYNYLVTR
ncbi:MAG: phosphatidylglycerophosphatase A [Holosporales bacterium]|jgi:phosphatidylglycerophosphatase A|nr:phosphatidylglycerophosphatase A [Holosporales bacterium]